MIIGAKLKGPDDPPDDEEEPPPKLSEGLESLDKLVLEPIDAMDIGEEVVIVAAEEKIPSRSRFAPPALIP